MHPHPFPNKRFHIWRALILVILACALAAPAFAQHFVTITFTPSTSTVAGYNTYRGTTSGGPYTLINASPFPAPPYTDPAVTAGTKYFYVLTSITSAGVESIFSSETSVTVPGATPPPPPPAATPYVISAITPLSFTAAAGGTAPTQNFEVMDSSPIAATMTMAVNSTPAGWLTLVKAAANTAAGNVTTIGVNTAGLAAGTYSGTVTITIPNQSGDTWTNSPYSLPVKLTITAPAPPPTPSLACPQHSNTTTTDVVYCTIGGFSKGQTGTMTWTPAGGVPVSVTVTHP